MNIFNYLVPLAVAAVAVVLLLGLWNMLRGGSASRSMSTKYSAGGGLYISMKAPGANGSSST